MSRIAAAFERPRELRGEGRRALIPFITAGDPNLQATVELLRELERSGAVVIELGVPFSDPMADGPVIQRASERALLHGFGLDQILETVAEAKLEIPVILFSYFNPLLQFGIERLCREARKAGIDGVLVTDLGPEESEEFSRSLQENNLDMIFLVAPTTTDVRLRMIAERATGFVYAVSRAGVTGAREDVSRDAERLVARLRNVTNLPVAVGFGISSASQVAETWRYADGAVVGSAIVAEIERWNGAPDLVHRIGDFTRGLIPVEQNLEALRHVD